MDGLRSAGAIIIEMSIEAQRREIEAWAEDPDEDPVLRDPEWVNAYLSSRAGFRDLKIELFAELADRRRIVTSDDYGSWGQSESAVLIARADAEPGQSPAPTDDWQQRTSEQIREELAEEPERWDRLILTLHDVGVEMEPLATARKRLAALPFSVEVQRR